MSALEIVGRSSSHFTRVTRIFAHELAVPHTFRPVLDLTSMAPDAYAGHPALKVPTLVDDRGALFGSENICRELARRSTIAAQVVMRGEVDDRIVQNAEELTVHVMTAEVSLILAKLAGHDRLAPPKVRRSMETSLDYLDAHVDTVIATLPAERVLSFVEVGLFCVVRHLPFREIMDVTAWSRLAAFCDRFGERPAAKATEYHFDRAPSQVDH
jgi:glutathione S-transferase